MTPGLNPGAIEEEKFAAMEDAMAGPFQRRIIGPWLDPELLDLARAWDGLAPDRQRAIGIGAILSWIGTTGEMDDLSPPQAYRAAAHHGEAMLEDALRLSLFGSGPPPRPDLDALGIRTCRRCGCTDECGCDDGCGWVDGAPGPSLCTRCAERAPAGEPE
ncbi:MAG TPA: hypothetical protein VNE67_09175 [Acetobacteraceae bacterium]|nr:hypothetical protein [Acetobacteraceae bacterium]